MSPFSLTYKPFGEAAILIEWPPQMNEKILDDILFFHQKIQNKNLEYIYEIIQSINSLTVIYDNSQVSFHSLKQVVKKIYKEPFIKTESEHFLWKIPVCYHPNFGVDLELMALKKEMSIEQIILLHTETIYRVFSIGFLPGFLYLGGLDEKLHIDRKSSPRLNVPKGAVAIGGKQTGIYPKSSPGGWQIIGNTPIPLFDKTNEVPCFAKSGDKIQFVRISQVEHQRIQNQINSKSYILEKEVIDD